MLSIIVKKNAELIDESGKAVHYEYKLIEHNGIYNIVCINNSSFTEEVYTGVSDDKEVAVKVFNLICKESVAPEHLNCIIDDILSEICYGI